MVYEKKDNNITINLLKCSTNYSTNKIKKIKYKFVHMNTDCTSFQTSVVLK